MSVIYAWLIDGASRKDIEKIDQLLYDAPPESMREDAPGWSDEETFDSFVSASAVLQNSPSRLGSTQ